jgi:hypothetical protein
MGVSGWRPKLARPKISHVTVSSAVVWFAAIAMARRTFLKPCPTCHRPIFIPKLATNVASILLAALSMVTIVCPHISLAAKMAE